MKESSSMLLIGIGTAGCAIVRGVNRAFGEGLRHVLLDTDAKTGAAGGPFVLLGGDRLSGRGAGGDTVAARLAAEESIQTIDEHIEGVRLAVIATALGGGTGCGATLETVTHLSERGIPSIVFATLPFSFEGEERKRNARGIMSMIEELAHTTFFLPLDKLVQNEDIMDDAMRRAIDTVATGVTLFWRLAEKPGYIRLDTERIRHIISTAGRGRFTAISVQGATRADDAVDQLSRSELLTTASAPVRSILCGILAGDDLRLSEIDRIVKGIKDAFGERLTFDLGTVNDEETFSGRISIVLMLFESPTQETEKKDDATQPTAARRTKKSKSPLGIGPNGRGRFHNAEQTFCNGEDLDIPTFIRRHISLEF